MTTFCSSDYLFNYTNVRLINKIEINKWIAGLMTHLQKFYLNDDFSFVYNNMSPEFGLAACDIKLVYKGNDKDYFSSDFERILTKCCESSPCQHWARIEIPPSDSILWFA